MHGSCQYVISIIYERLRSGMISAENDEIINNMRIINELGQVTISVTQSKIGDNFRHQVMLNNNQ